MYYVGLDVHTKQSTYCILDDNGKKVKTETVKGTWDVLLLKLAMLPRPFRICYEASTGYGYLYRRLVQIAEQVVVAHPGQLRLIFRAKRKFDRVDAEKQAKLLYLGEVPPVWVPSVEVQAWRSAIERRQEFLAERTRAKNQLRAMLRSEGLTTPKGLWTKKGLVWLKAVEFPTRFQATQRDLLLLEVDRLTEAVKTLEKHLAEYAKDHPGVTLLRTIPGVGIRTAEAVMAYVDDPKRFPSGSGLACYVGLVPCQDQSAGTNHLGHITRQGPGTVRKLLVEAAWQAIRRSPAAKAFFERVKREDPERTKIALVATAHWLVKVMHAMLRTGEVWRQTPAA